MTNEEVKIYIGELKMYANSKGWDKEYLTACDIVTNALEQESCEDAISRQAVLDEMYKRKANNDAITAGFIKNLPSVTSQPKMGQWIKKDRWDGEVDYDCSICGDGWTTIDGEPWNNGMNYCPNCGAKMQEVKE